MVRAPPCDPFAPEISPRPRHASNTSLLEQVWATTNAPEIKFVPATIDGKTTEIAWLLDDDDNVLFDAVVRFLEWYRGMDGLQQKAIHNAKSYLMVCTNVACHRRNLHVVTKGTFNSKMSLQIVEKESTRAQGMAKTLGCSDTSTRSRAMRSRHRPSRRRSSWCRRT